MSSYLVTKETRLFISHVTAPSCVLGLCVVDWISRTQRKVGQMNLDVSRMMTFAVVYGKVFTLRLFSSLR